MLVTLVSCVWSLTIPAFSFDVLEISSGFLSIPTDDWASLIEFTAAHGLKPKPEVGIQ